ncbi:MAG: bifunctional DNA-formamidopyrimidine glycosylase/DNA-(apurinic or apyrimidinic site) lyase, partial [Anaerolineae bacterium]
NSCAMPELPEVENYRRDLQAMLAGRRITGVSVDWPNQVGAPSVEELARRLPGQTIESIGRRGKYLLFRLSGGDTLLIHLKMSGRLHIEPASAPPDHHAHVVFRLDAGDELRFHDPRKFGRVYLVGGPDEVVGSLGPEPLSEDFSAERFARMLAGRRGRIKPLLLNQTFLAGLGNIYADEALHQAGLHPLRTADTLALDEVARLHTAIQSTLRSAIQQRGTSFDGFYLDARGEPGAYQSRLRVYGRAGEPCRRCGTLIERIVVGQRGTHLCPVCQPAP